MLGYNLNEKNYGLWKVEKIKQLLKWCETQKEAVKKEDFAELLLIQRQKLKVIEEIKEKEKTASWVEGLEKQERLYLKEILQRLAQCEEELRKLIEKKRGFLKNRLIKINEGLDTMRCYRTKLPTRTKFVNIKG